MYSIAFQYSSTAIGFKGIIIDLISIKTRDGKSYKSLVIGICADFSAKDQVKDYCRKKGGTWHPVKKYWYFPIDSGNKKELINQTFRCCKEIIDLFAPFIRCGELINLSVDLPYNEHDRIEFEKEVANLFEIENQRKALKIQWDSMPNLQIVESEIDEEYAHENNREIKGIALLDNGKFQNVWIHSEGIPSDFAENQNLIGGIYKYRQFKAQNGKKYWCTPASETGWDDEWFDETIEVLEKSASLTTKNASNSDVTTACEIIFSQEKNVFWVYFYGEYAFDTLLCGFKRYVKCRKWDPIAKRWEVPQQELKELAYFIKKYEFISKYGYKIDVDATASSLMA